MVLRPRHGLSLCAGAGGLDMGLMLAEPGFHTRCFVEWEPYPRSAIIAAQRAGYFAPAPIWDDLTTFDGNPLRGAIDTILAGYPCQPFSSAGQRKGADDPRHLWPHVARVIREVEPRWVFLENVAGHISLGAETVLRELWDMGFTPAAGAFSAAEVGAPHERLRWFCVAYRDTDADAGRMERGRADRRTSEGQGGREQRQRVRAGLGGGCECMGHPARIGCGEGRAEPELRGGRDTAAGTGGAMADASGARAAPWGPEPQRGQQWDAVEPVHHRGPLFPPGPDDRAAWADALAIAPDLAPATGLADCLAWAGHLAQAVDGLEQAPAQSRLCRMADGLAARSRALRLLGNGVHPLGAANAWRALAAAHGLGAVDLEAAGAEAGDGAGGIVVMAAQQETGT